MDVTNRYVLDFARRHGGRILDYGCGGGALVRAGLDEGLDIYGADMFYGGSQSQKNAEASGLYGTRILQIHGGRLPFPDAEFDLVTNNQVMEHVEDLDAVLAEIRRVLKPGGTVLSIFPASDVWREGHIGIPFAHWFRRGSRTRFLYTWALRSLGCGTWKEQAPTARQWAVDKLDWIDRWTRYRSRQEILQTYGRYFVSNLVETDYIRYRLLDTPGSVRRLFAYCIDWPGFSSGASAIFRKLAFLVITSRPGDIDEYQQKAR